MKRYSRRIGLLALPPLLLMLAACGGGSGSTSNGAGDGKPLSERKEAAPVAKPPEPITLTIYNHASLGADMFEKVVATPIRNKFPHITVEKIDNKPLDEVIASGMRVDIISSLVSNMITMLDRQYLIDLNPVVKKSNFPISDYYDQVSIKLIQAHGKNGEFYGMPSVKSNVAMYYNKDIFDRYGVPYPKDGLTWDEAYELAKRLTRQEGERKIYGMDMDLTNLLGQNQLSLPFIDPKTGKAAIHTAEWSEFIRTLNRFFEIPGSRLSANTGNARDAFVKDKSVAMLVSSSILGTASGEASLNWGLATTPGFTGRPNINTQLSANYYGITTTSRQQDAAFEVIKLLVSDEVMTLNAQNGRLPATNRPDVVKKFALVNPEFDAKINLAAYYKNKHAETPEVSASKNFALSALMAAFKQTIEGKDINTALREAQEKADKDIESAGKK